MASLRSLLQYLATFSEKSQYFSMYYSVLKTNILLVLGQISNMTLFQRQIIQRQCILWVLDKIFFCLINNGMDDEASF